MQKPKPNNGKIIIRGREYVQDYFTPQPFDEFTLTEVVRHISDVGDIARGGTKDIECLIGNCPLTYIEGLLRYQLRRLIDDDHAQYFSELTDLVAFDNFCDLMAEQPEHIPDSKTVFLFHFLKDVVFLSCYPEQISHHQLEKIAANLRSLSFLVEPQLNGKTKPSDDAFEYFAFAVWHHAGCKNISAKHWWNAAKNWIKENEGEIIFEMPTSQWGGVSEKKHRYVAHFDKGAENDKEKLKIECETPGIRTGKPKGQGQINNIWVGLQNKIIKRMQKNSA